MLSTFRETEGREGRNLPDHMGSTGTARPGAWESGRQLLPLTDWQVDGGRSYYCCPQGAHNPGEGCGCGKVEGKHRAESDSWLDLKFPCLCSPGLALWIRAQL